MPATAGQNRGPLKPVHSPFLLEDWSCHGHKETAEKSSFLPAEGIGTHKPARKCKQEVRSSKQNQRCNNNNYTKRHCLARWKCYKPKLILYLPSSNSKIHQIPACSHYLHPSPATSPSSFPVLVLGRNILRQQQGQNSLFSESILDICLLFPSMELFCFPWVSYRNHQIAFRLCFLFSPSHCPGAKLNDWAAIHTSSCSRSTWYYCCFNFDVGLHKGILRCFNGSHSPWADLQTDVPGSEAKLTHAGDSWLFPPIHSLERYQKELLQYRHSHSLVKLLNYCDPLA